MLKLLILSEVADAAADLIAEDPAAAAFIARTVSRIAWQLHCRDQEQRAAEADSMHRRGFGSPGYVYPVG